MPSGKVLRGVSFWSEAACPPPRSHREVTQVTWQQKRKMEAAYFMDRKDVASGWVMEDQTTSEVEEFDCHSGYTYICEDWIGYLGISRATPSGA